MTDDSYDMIANNNDFTHLHAWLRTHTAKYFDDFIVVTPEVERWYQRYFHRGIWLPIIMDDAKAETNYERLLPLSRQPWSNTLNRLIKKSFLRVGLMVMNCMLGIIFQMSLY